MSDEPRTEKDYGGEPSKDDDETLQAKAREEREKKEEAAREEFNLHEADMRRNPHG
jgi:hypothetical protein